MTVLFVHARIEKWGGETKRRKELESGDEELFVSYSV